MNEAENKMPSDRIDDRLAEAKPLDLPREFKVGVVIPVGPGRRQNLIAVLRSLAAQEVKPSRIVLVCDGDEAMTLSHEVQHIVEGPPNFPDSRRPMIPLTSVLVQKHEPGMEQPRNIGVRMMKMLDPEVTHVWFCDSDVILDKRAGREFDMALRRDPNRILIGPYEWLPPHVREPAPDLYNDPRWESFHRHSMKDTVTNDLSAGLACFSGNLIWPISEFERVGGFWNEIHHGRCEDGELGLRAVAMDVPIGFVAFARGWHLDHDRNMDWIVSANARDVPMLNERHPWVEGEGLFVVEKDGKRFDARCQFPGCRWSGNTAEIWAHQAKHNPADQMVDAQL